MGVILKLRLLLGKPFSPPPHRLVITTDASCRGWGGGRFSLHTVFRGLDKGGSAGSCHFSLELRAVFLALMSFEELVQGQFLLIRSDNTTIVADIIIGGVIISPPPSFLSVDVESMEVVSSETHSPIRFSFFGGGKSVSSFSF